MTTYTKINKPTGTQYTNENPVGKIQYDQADVMYDDPGIFYDGTNPGLYTNINKPVGTAYTKINKPT